MADDQEVQDSGAPAEPTAASGASKPAAASTFPAIDPAAAKGASAKAVDKDERVRLLRDVSLRVRVELGRGKMLMKDLLRLTRGSVVELDKVAGDPLDIYVNNRLIARGEVLVLDEKFCIRITEILTPEDCLRVNTG